MSKCKVIAVANQKCGVEKTTKTENAAIGLARNGNEVLIVDFDPQGDLTACLDWKNNDSLENTVSTMLDEYIDDKNIARLKRIVIDKYVVFDILYRWEDSKLNMINIEFYNTESGECPIAEFILS